MGAPRFLPAGIYGSAAVADAERRQYAPRFWHPLLPLDLLESLVKFAVYVFV